MSNAKKVYLAVAGGLVALGVVMAGIGWAIAGFDAGVFSTQVDLRGDGTVTLGGTVVDDPTGLPLIEQIAGIGEIDTSSPAASDAPDAPAAPVAP